ncbi:MAG: hypothetical protein ACJ8G4_00720 [Burkholderiales bacterium]
MKLRAPAIISTVLVLGIPATSLGDDDDHGRGLQLKADPFVFVGKPGDCGGGYPAGSNIVTAAWLGGMGLPDNGGQNSGINPADNPNKRDPHLGLLLSKNGPTADCSAAGAEIKGVKGVVVSAAFQLGFDYRNGSHCGGGAPRFNVVTRTGSVETFHFVGNCAVGINTPAEQDPLQWTTIRFSAAVAVPPILPGSRIESITLIFDEGTDQPSPVPASSGDINGIGLAVVDNIFINGRSIPSGKGVEPKPGERGHDD